MLEGKVLKDFNDKQNRLKNYKKGQKFKAEEVRYKELQEKGYLEAGKEVAIKKDKQVE